MIKVSDYIFNRLADFGVKHLFMITGGGAMHLNDSAGRCTNISYICNHHEQAATIAAEGYARCTNQIGVAVVTSGPGGTNAITGVMGAWVDSIPMLVLSGQVKVETTIVRAPGLRQLGDQEINITDIVRPITKYAAMVTDKNDIAYHLDKALFLAENGRPGPVWLDIPLDVQGSMIDEESLHRFESTDPIFDSTKVDEQVADLLEKLAVAKRPVIIAGNGVRLAGAVDEFSAFVKRLGVPVLTAISGVDLLPTDFPYFFGRPGILGARAANFIMQNSDLLIILGTRMNLRQIGYAYDTFAREAFKVAVDIDHLELTKPTIKLDIAIHSDAGYFMRKLVEVSERSTIRPNIDTWLSYCNKCKKTFPVVEEEQRTITNWVSSYYFAECLSEELEEGATIVTGNGTAYTSTYQAFGVKQKQRMFANVGCASMGYDLPAAIGASVANDRSEVICITGDGSIQMNLQELQTIINYHLPIKIFVFNNDGYLSIKTTQNTFFGGNLVGSTPESGVGLPSLEKLAFAYGISFCQLKDHSELRQGIRKVLDQTGPVICEVMTDPMEKLYPKVASLRLPDGRIVSKPLEDLSPCLPREQFAEFMLVKQVQE